MIGEDTLRNYLSSPLLQKETCERMPAQWETKNIFENIPENLPEELFEIVFETNDVKIERIVSRGHTSPPGFWYDQAKSEYVILLKGSAGLRFKGKNEIAILRPGDSMNIPSHVKHRVEWTDPNQDTVWLAIHYL